jgi:arylesterase/paraoxonase
LLRSGDGTLMFHDGQTARVVASGLGLPAGLALSPDGTRLYLAEALAQSLRIYARDTASNALTLQETLPLGTAPHNLNVDADGVVWIAAHPKLLRFLAQSRGAAKPAPTQILRFDPREKDPAARLRQIYLDDGKQISAGTVAASWRDQFLIGALLDKKVLICKQNP